MASCQVCGGDSVHILCDEHYSGWIPVDQELPESVRIPNKPWLRKEDILIRNKNGWNYLGWFWDGKFWSEDNDARLYVMGIESISHWMKIQPPEDK